MADYKQPSPVDVLIELTFPVSGLNQGTEYQLQPNGSTSDALNVRTRDITLRDRGGSRAGILKYTPDPVAAIGAEVQLLDTIVTTGLAALSGDYTVPDDRINVDYILDPSDGIRNPGWIVPFGGSGIQPNRNLTNIDTDEEQRLMFGTVQTGGFVRLVVNGVNVVASPFSGAVAPVGAKVIVVKNSGVYRYQPLVWV